MNEPMSSGEVLGAVTSVLGVRADILDLGISDSTLKRVFRGKAVDPDSLDRVFCAFIRACWIEVAGIETPPLDDDTVVEFASHALRVARTWDERRARPTLAEGRRLDGIEIPFFRLVAVDLGLRAGAAVGLGLVQGHSIERWSEAHRSDLFRVAVDDERAKRSDKRTDAELAAECRVEKNTFSMWMTGGDLPEDSNVVRLAMAFAGDDAKDWQPVHRSLTHVVRVRRLFMKLAHRTSTTTAQDLLIGFVATARVASGVLQGYPVTDKQRTSLARGLLGGGSMEGDLGALVHAIADRVPGTPAWFLDVMSVRGDWALRLNWWAHSLGTNPAAVESLQLLRFVVTESPERQEALNRLLAKVLPTDVLTSGALQRMSFGDFSSAEELLRLVLQERPSNTHALYNLAIALVRQPFERSRFVEARKHCEEVLRLEPASPKAALELGVIAIDLGDLDAADLHLQHAQSLGADAASAAYHRGLIAVEQGRLTDALALYERAWNHNPNYADAAHSAGGVLLELGQRDAAYVWAKRAAALGNDDLQQRMRATGRAAPAR
jgi:hypothetical protein